MCCWNNCSDTAVCPRRSRAVAALRPIEHSVPPTAERAVPVHRYSLHVHTHPPPAGRAHTTVRVHLQFFSGKPNSMVVFLGAGSLMSPDGRVWHEPRAAPLSGMPQPRHSATPPRACTTPPCTLPLHSPHPRIGPYPRSQGRSSRRWVISEDSSQNVSDPRCGTRCSSVRSRQSCRPGVIQRPQYARCIVSNRAGIGQGVRAGYVPQVGEVAAASPNGRMMARCARGRGLERRRRASQRLGSPR